MTRLAPWLTPLALAFALVVPGVHAADNDPDWIALSQRLQTLESDPRLAGLAAYERLQARQALEALAAARSSQRPGARQIAERRLEIAETMARTEATRREIDRLDRERSDLLIEASRQEAARARAEAERLRVEAQIQLEEAQRLRAAVEAEALARQEAEDLIVDVGSAETAKLKAAREREAELARREAELMAGDKPAASAPAKRPAKPKGGKPR